jgi:hypothetical protein
VLRLIANSGSYNLTRTARTFQLIPGKRYRLSAWARQVSGGGSFYLRLWQLDASETQVAYNIGVEGITLSGSFVRYSGISVDTAPNATHAGIYFWSSYSTGPGVVDMADIRCEEVLPGELIVDGGITARKLAIVGGGGAVTGDPDTIDFGAWNYTDSRFGIVPISDVPGVTTVIQSVTAASSVVAMSRPVSFDPNKTYRVRGRARDGGSNGFFWLVVDLHDISGNIISGDGTYWYYPAFGVTPTVGFTTYEGKFGAGTSKPFPSNARTMSVGAILNYSGSTGYQQVTDLLIEEAVDGSLIVDGAITATKLAANSIAVGTAAIQNGAIVNAMIGNAAIDDAKILSLQVNKISGGTLGADIAIGAGRITYDNGSFLRAQGTGFGSANQFVDWFGPRPSSGNLSLCTESNATYYLKTNGDAYFGGTLAAGLLKNAAQTTDTAVPASVVLGPFLTNGHAKTIVVSYQYRRTFRCNASTGSVSGTGTAVVLLEKSTDGVSFTTIGTLNVSQNGGTVVVDGDPSVKDVVTFLMGGSMTVTDNQGATNNMYLRARLTSRSLPSMGGTSITGDTITQSTGFISTES